LSESKLVTAFLCGADLAETDLSGANLNEADLGEADLTGAKLAGAKLNRTRLHGATLVEVDLSSAKFNDSDLSSLKGSRMNLSGATLSRSNLTAADLRGANLIKAKIVRSDLSRADLTGANLRGAQLIGADLTHTSLASADLQDTDLSRSRLISTSLDNATLVGARIFGVSTWGLKLDGCIQRNLVINNKRESTITVDDVEMAQFIHLLINNDRIRSVIDTITSKVVLILGRFTPERKAILDSIREKLRLRNYLPVLFDFDKPVHRSLTETVSTIAHMARFVIADLTGARSIPQELSRIVPNLSSVPVQPILLATEEEYGMFESFKSYPWVLPIVRYDDQKSLLNTMNERVIEPAELMAIDIADHRTK
jgi:uncharacterized protein YjbI with pentapeptide repeats